jgi:hypothetical protein
VLVVIDFTELKMVGATGFEPVLDDPGEIKEPKKAAITQTKPITCERTSPG